MSVKANYKYVRIIKNVTERFLLSEGIDEDEVYMMKLAIAEAASNIIKHSYCLECVSPIEYIIEKNEKMYKFILRDYGRHVELSGIKSRELDNYKESGLGVHLIKSIMDEVKYEHMDIGTRLTMSKIIGDGCNGKR
jgi:serine/threonine-protein kinase RsbW